MICGNGMEGFGRGSVEPTYTDIWGTTLISETVPQQPCRVIDGMGTCGLIQKIYYGSLVANCLVVIFEGNSSFPHSIFLRRHNERFVDVEWFGLDLDGWGSNSQSKKETVHFQGPDWQETSG